MKKSALILAGGAAALCLGYLGTKAYIGSEIGAQVRRYEAILIARDDVRVRRFDYEHGLFSGRLHYDLDWRPVPGGEGYPLLELASLAGQNLSLQGSLAFSHGPWVGGHPLVALARFEGQLAAPRALRDSLPQYPGQTPFVTLRSTLGFDDVLHTAFEGLDYQGSFIEGDSRGAVTLRGLSGFVETDSSLTHLVADLKLAELALRLEEGPSPADFLLEGLHWQAGLREDASPAWTGALLVGVDRAVVDTPDGKAEMSAFSTRVTAGFGEALLSDIGELQLTEPRTLDVELTLAGQDFTVTDGSDPLSFQLRDLSSSVALIQDESSVWLGTSDLRLGTLALDSRDLKGSLDGLSMDAATERAQDKINNRADFRVATMSYAGESFGGLAIESSLRDVDAGAYAALEELAGVNWDMLPAGERADQRARLMAALEKALAGSPSFQLHKANLALLGEDDLNAALTLAFDAPSPFSLDDPAAVLAAVRLDFDLRVSRPALEELAARIGAASQPPQSYRSELDELYASEYVALSGDFLSLTLELRDAALKLNQQEPVPLADSMQMLTSVGAGLFPAAPGGSSVGGGQDATFNTIVLRAGFMPDPHSIALVAGGGELARDYYGIDCEGFINAELPDVVLDYTAGVYDLLLYAESEADTTLVIRRGDTWYCDDDGYSGINPGVVITAPASGSYEIWVGTYEQALSDATLNLSELAAE